MTGHCCYIATRIPSSTDASVQQNLTQRPKHHLMNVWSSQGLPPPQKGTNRFCFKNYFRHQLATPEAVAELTGGSHLIEGALGMKDLHRNRLLFDNIVIGNQILLAPVVVRRKV